MERVRERATENASPGTSSVVPTYSCRWGRCSLTLDTSAALVQHVKEHIWKSVPTEFDSAIMKNPPQATPEHIHSADDISKRDIPSKDSELSHGLDETPHSLTSSLGPSLTTSSVTFPPHYEELAPFPVSQTTPLAHNQGFQGFDSVSDDDCSIFNTPLHIAKKRKLRHGESHCITETPTSSFSSQGSQYSVEKQLTQSNSDDEDDSQELGGSGSFTKLAESQLPTVDGNSNKLAGTLASHLITRNTLISQFSQVSQPPSECQHSHPQTIVNLDNDALPTVTGGFAVSMPRQIWYEARPSELARLRRFRSGEMQIYPADRSAPYSKESPSDESPTSSEDGSSQSQDSCYPPLQTQAPYQSQCPSSPI